MEYVCSELVPDQVEYLHTLGAAQYRAGRYAEACATLRGTAERREGLQDFAFLAMALQRLGQADEARAMLDLARAKLPKAEADADHLPRFVNEAEQLIR